jgi:hypothetical protein
MNKVLSAASLLGVLLCLPSAVMAEGSSEEKILHELEYLRTKVMAQQEHIDAIEGVQNKKGQVVLANEFIDQLTLKGDLRVRYERQSKEYNSQADSIDVARDRWRTRFRLGGVWANKGEDWEVGAGLASGSDDPASTNDTWSENKPFESGDIRLDYAFAAHQWQDFKFTMGQQHNPYESSWVLWDTDVRLAGLTGRYGKKDGLFATLGGYGAKLVNSDNTSILYMGQGGYRGRAGAAKYTVAVGAHKYDQTLINDKTNLNNIDSSKYGLEVGDLYGKVSLPLAGAKLDLYGHVWKNFGADGDLGQSQVKDFPNKPGDADLGWVLGLEAKIDKVKLGYAYAVVEADSMYGYLGDADLGDGLGPKTNKKGHRVQAGYSFSKNWSADVTWMSYKQDKAFYSANNKVDNVNLYQFDMSYKF